MTVFNGMDVLDSDGHPFAFVIPHQFNWPIELYAIDPRYPQFMCFRDFLLMPFMPVLPQCCTWHYFPDPARTHQIIDGSNVPEF